MTETGVLRPRKCLPCSLYVVFDCCVSGLGLVLFMIPLLLCSACMVSYQSFNQSINRPGTVFTCLSSYLHLPQNGDHNDECLHCKHETIAKCMDSMKKYKNSIKTIQGYKGETVQIRLRSFSATYHR